MSNKQKKGLQSKGYEKFDARQKFERAQKNLKILRLRLSDSKKKEEQLSKEKDEIAQRRKRLMARDYLEQGDRFREKLEKINQQLKTADRKLAEAGGIREGLVDLSRRSEEELVQLEINYLAEGEELCAGKLEELTKSYLIKKTEADNLKKQAAEVKAQRRFYHNRRRELERIR